MTDGAGRAAAATRLRLLAIAAVALAVPVALSLAGPELVDRSGSLAFYLLFLLAALSFPARVNAILIPAGAALVGILMVIDRIKAKLTMAPLTWTDLVVFGNRPLTSLEALKLPDAQAMALLAIGALAVLTAGFIVYLVLTSRLLAHRLAALTVCIGAAALSLPVYGSAAHDLVRQRDIEVWEPTGLRALSLRIGLPGFLALTYYLERNDPGLLFARPDGEAPAAREVRRAADGLIDLDRHRPRPMPNIVVVLAESTFDPDLVFNLRQSVDAPLTTPNAFTQLLGPLYVNAVGGGTWMSEFEFFTGLDTRLFGYSGYYTHTSLSPLVQNSFIHYLNRNGYTTSAYYGTDGAFFNAENAFPRYGFSEFLDMAELGIDAPDWSATDNEIADAVLAASRGSDPSRPFFKHVTFLQNHSPHICDEPAPGEGPVAQFEAEATDEQSCKLNKYVRNLFDSGAAVEKLRRYLVDVEQRTGRPFVLLVFGDHQPHTFTSTGEESDNFMKFRRIEDPRTTFYHFMSSMESPLEFPRGAHLPLTLLPTLLSAYVAASPEDLYLPGGLYAYRECGYDFLGIPPSSGVSGLSGLDEYLDGHAMGARSACPALDAIIAYYERSGVMRLP